MLKLRWEGEYVGTDGERYKEKGEIEEEQEEEKEMEKEA